MNNIFTILSNASYTKKYIRGKSFEQFKTLPINSIYTYELPIGIPRNSMESDRGCTSRIYFDNAGENVTLASQKPCKHNNKCV